MKKPVLEALLLLLASCILTVAQTGRDPVSLFDGKTLDGWDYNSEMWQVQDGVITGGLPTKKVLSNDFISTKKSFQNFELKLAIRCSGDPTTGLINSGIQIRSMRIPGSTGVTGYQIDCGQGWFGKIYDEHRRNKTIDEPVDQLALLKAVDVYGWNRYRILAEGPRIRVWINDVIATDYTEKDPDIALDGIIAPQIHSGGRCVVELKDVYIRELPNTEGAPTWDSLGGVESAIHKMSSKKQSKTIAPRAPVKNNSYNKVDGDPKTASEQQKLFRLPEGYEIELVIQESEGMGKFVSVYFDQRGRLWTQTALEYPVDANENASAAESLYQRHARDKVLVYPRDSLTNLPEGGLENPTIFADGLAIPLGLLPWGNGDSAYVLQGHDLLLLNDTDGDGKADERQVILTGFGIQDSHLFPHQFTRVPGGWIWMAQGLFNDSKVKRPGDDRVIPWEKCSMARVRPDGSKFEVISTGPNNIWGLAMTGEGEAFIQEANDYGYPVMAFHEYAYYPGGMVGHKKTYQPSFPPTTEFRLGGTSLSGLALLENGPNIDAAADMTMLVANPIVSKVQSLGMRRDGPRWNIDQLPDMVTCADPYFRPVAMTQGPDGCLYIVDWYNKIISHNEVPRNHPDRDKTRGRIWRVKPESGKGIHEIPDFTALKNEELIAMLGTEPTSRAHLVWQTLADRNDPTIETALESMLQSEDSSDAQRIQALWINEELGTIAGRQLHSSKNRNLRRELARYPSHALAFLEDLDPEVRFAALTTTCRQLPDEAGQLISQVISHVKPSISGPYITSSRTGKLIPVREAYEREFERFLIRFFLEQYPKEVSTFLDSEFAHRASLEGRILAALALPPVESASRIASLLPKLSRKLNTEELLRIAQFPEIPGCGEALTALLANPNSRARTAMMLLDQKTVIDSKKIAPLLIHPVRSLIKGEDIPHGIELVSAFLLTELEPDLISLVEEETVSQSNRRAALVALRQIRSREVDLFAFLAVSSNDTSISDAALAALAASRAPNAGAKLVELYSNLDITQRRNVLRDLSSSKSGANALVAAIKEKKIPAAALDGPTAERLAIVLGNDPEFVTLMDSLDHVFREVLLLDGSPAAYAEKDINLEGSFTVEAWVRLAPGIDSRDSLLGAPNVFDLNFFNSIFRVWAGPGLRDVAISSKPLVPGHWTHLAVTRNTNGEIKIFLNGELDSIGIQQVSKTFSGLRVGWSNPQDAGTKGALAEYRVWNCERTEGEIRKSFDHSFAHSKRPDNLVFYNPGGSANWGELGKGARVARTIDLPPLLTPEQAEALNMRFANYTELGRKGGNVENGKTLSLLCTACHIINGQGSDIGPDLSGASAMGLESILRNILTPNAAMESGYRIYRIEMVDGDVLDTFFVSEDEQTVVIRQPGLSDRRIPKQQIRAAQFIRRSLMPEDLLEALSDEQVADLLAYLINPSE